MAHKDPITEAITKETRMQARVAKQVARMKREIALFEPLKAYVSPKSGGKSLLRGIAAGLYRALDRPGVAPTTKPKSAAGGETFHFALTAVSKTSPFTRALTGEREGAAAAHESYIEREDAPEQFEHAQARFIENAGRLAGRILPKDVDIAIQGQEYIERQGALEAAAQNANALSMYGNLPANYDERLAFWEAVEAHEREPRTHDLSLDPSKNPEVWQRIANDPMAPKEVLAAAALPKKTISLGRGKDAKTREVLGELKLTEARALEVLAYLKSVKGSSKLASWTPGRGGHVQMRLIISLPYELSADDRIALLKSFCDSQFRNLKADDGASVDVPFWAVVHKPEATSDDRNYHAHIVFSERPARQIQDPKTGDPVWDFAYSETIRDSKRTSRIRHPKEQPKVRSLNDRQWPHRARTKYAQLANSLLEDRGISKRLDPRSYKDMGIEIDPIQRMKPNDSAKEKKGQNSATGAKTIDAQWDRINASLDQRFSLKTFYPPPAQQTRFDGEIRRWKTFDHPAHYMLISARRRWREAWFKARVLDADAAAAAVAIERMRSKYDAPGKSRLHEHPEIAEFFTAMADKYVAAPRIEAANQRLTQQQMIEYANALTTARGPVMGDSLSQLLHKTVGSVHPSKIKGIDNLVSLANGYIGLINSGVIMDMSTYGETLAARPKDAPQDIQPLRAPPAANYVTAPNPPRPYAPLPPGTKTPFKSTAGRVFGKADELIFKIRKITQAQQDKIRHYEWQKQDDAARLARIAAMNADSATRVTTSPLIDDRPFKRPDGAQPQKASPSAVKAAPPAAAPIATVAKHQAPASQTKTPPVAPANAPAANVVRQPAPASATAPAAAKAPPPAKTAAAPPAPPAKAPDPEPTSKTTPVSAAKQPEKPPVLAPSPSVRKQSASSAPQKDVAPTAPAKPEQPAQEPPRASKEQLDALERRKKRRRAMFLTPAKDRGRSR